MDFRKELIALVECYVEATKRSEARTANLAGRDSRFFARLREGKGCTVDTLAHMRQWFSDEWPADAEWPEGIARPAPQRAPSLPKAAPKAAPAPAEATQPAEAA